MRAVLLGCVGAGIVLAAGTSWAKESGAVGADTSAAAATDGEPDALNWSIGAGLAYSYGANGYWPSGTSGLEYALTPRLRAVAQLALGGRRLSSDDDDSLYESLGGSAGLGLRWYLLTDGPIDISVGGILSAGYQESLSKQHGYRMGHEEWDLSAHFDVGLEHRFTRRVSIRLLTELVSVGYLHRTSRNRDETAFMHKSEASGVYGGLHIAPNLEVRIAF